MGACKNNMNAKLSQPVQFSVMSDFGKTNKKAECLHKKAWIANIRFFVKLSPYNNTVYV